MAGRTLNRRELRKQSDAAEQMENGIPDDANSEAAPAKKTRKKAAAGAKVRKPRAKKAPARMRARWGVFDGSMKQVAIYDFNQKGAADEKLAVLLATKKGGHFMQIVKEAIIEAPPVAVSVE